MKRKCYSYFMGLLGICVSMAVHSFDGQINFTGNITTPTCRVNNGAGAINVKLPTVSSSSLSSNGQTAGSTDFIIKLSDCDDVPNVGAFFENSADVSPTDGRLVNSLNPRSNVQLELINKNLNTIQLGRGEAEQGIQYFDIKNGSANLEYKVRYYATGQALPGAVQAATTFLLVYP